MKFICLTLALLVAICVAKPCKNKEAMREKAQECATENGISMDEVKQVFKGAEPTAAHTCFQWCMMKKTGAVDEEGKLQAPPGFNHHKALTPEEQQKMAQCMPETVKSCEDAGKVWACAKTIKQDRSKNKVEEKGE